ncbi:glutamate ABC transporter substrate-binding protein [Peterkaempfera bronchialis]|uniref:Sugar-binding protein n=1 Tax=Peterkaempfera bronchialis TaxID=2126346 RepID=A0A345SV50_9ACTN|nr:glutamate ABC transporter substrate-binding protein [Peterkaempfera bronchialis]AXI77605.1 sugar-binding protein [Peterkaempfera bronchialis]
MAKPMVRLMAAAVAVAAALAGAGGSSPARPTVAAAGHTTAVQAAADDGCTPQTMTRSVPPSGGAGPKVAAIVRRGYLIAGVDQNSYRWGYRNPATGDFEGFDIDLVHAIAGAVLGDPKKVQYKTVPTAKRIEAITSGEVDLIARTMTISCKRLHDVAFSTAYFEAGQQIVVPRSSPARTVDQALRKRTVCAAEGSTAQEELEKDAHGATVHLVGNQLDCLVLMQLGRVDATMTDNALGAGQVAQDPTVHLIGRPLTVEPYGVAMNKKDTDLVARVNQVLEQYRNGSWQQSYRTWLEPYLGPSAGPPAARYLP